MPGINGIIDIKDLLIGDGTSGSIPYSGILISGHAVKCSEHGTAGESDAIKKVGFDEYLLSSQVQGCLYARFQCRPYTYGSPPGI